MTASDTFPHLVTKIVFQHYNCLSKRDRVAIDRILSWETVPTFFTPGRTAWYSLLDPIELDTGVKVYAAKIKGVGSWNPLNVSEINRVVGSKVEGLNQPSNDEYAAGIRRPHFGISEDGTFCTVESEPAPFGGITRKRAELEYSNAVHLMHAGIPATLPYCLVDYPELDTFRGETLSAVVTLAPTNCPTRLEYFLIGDQHLDEWGREKVKEFTTHFSRSPNPTGDVDLARLNIALEIGDLLRRMSATGLFRHASAWDNFMLDPGRKVIFLTDLDSTRLLADLNPNVRGLQQFRDLAGALYRLAGGLYRPVIIKSREFSQIRAHDPFAGIVSGYFQISFDRAQELVEPIWRYFGSHFFLIQREADRINAMSYEERTSYTMDRDIFYCLVICLFAEHFRRLGGQLGLEELPEQSVLDQNVADFLDERHEFLKLLAI